MNLLHNNMHVRVQLKMLSDSAFLIYLPKIMPDHILTRASNPRTRCGRRGLQPYAGFLVELLRCLATTAPPLYSRTSASVVLQL
jgi:hypothetical protein